MKPEAHGPHTQSVSPGIRRRILIADDNRDSADSLAMLLGLQGHDVRVAYGGQQSLEVAAEFMPEIAFLDIGMPGIDGYELARRLRQMPFTDRPILIAVTGWGRSEDKRLARDAGFDHHVTKPLEPDTLSTLLRPGP